MTKNEALRTLKQVISSEPWLSSEGFHSFEFFEKDTEKGKDNFGKEMTEREFHDNLADLRKKGWEVYWEEFANACALLESVGKVKAINKRYSSYGLKHLFEKKIGYLPNGVFIAAMIHSGFRYKIYNKSPNPCFNISNAALTRFERDLAL
ncbi:MAG: hypothetical protein LBH26_08200 [Treponema sp.]|nr:hypothetical protein [Treponema sp.]